VPGDHRTGGYTDCGLLTSSAEGSDTPSRPHVKILVLSPWNPYPPVFGARLRILSLLRALASREHREVHLLSFAEPSDDLELSRRYLAGFGIRARLIPHRMEKGSRMAELPSRLAAALRGVPFNAQLCRHPALRESLDAMLREHEFGLLMAETSWMGQHAAPLTGPRKLLSWQNVDFDVYARRATGDTNPLVRAVRRYNHRIARRFELALIPRFDAMLTVTEADRRFLRETGAATPPVHVVPICVDTAGHPLEGDAERAVDQIVFVGAMFYEPNADAVTYFHREIYPRIRDRAPGVRFVIVGRNPADAVRRLARVDPSVSVTGTVEDVRGYYRNSTVFVAPIRHGGGMKTKIVEAMAAGLPVVATSFAMEGIEARNGEEAFIADDPEDFATRVVNLLDDRSLRQRLAVAAQALVERSHSWEALAHLLDGIVEERAPA
jgi:polysaccharide biosynthesis protein PslH